MSHRDGQSHAPSGDESLTAHLTHRSQDRVQRAHPDDSSGHPGCLPRRPLHLSGFSATSPRQAAQVELVAAPRTNVRLGHDRDVVQVPLGIHGDFHGLSLLQAVAESRPLRSAGAQEEEEDGRGDEYKWGAAGVDY